MNKKKGESDKAFPLFLLVCEIRKNPDVFELSGVFPV